MCVIIRIRTKELTKIAQPTKLCFCVVVIMANEKNLRPGEYKLSQEEAKRGGQNSGVARRRKILLKAMLPGLLKRGAFSEADLALLESFGMDPEEVNQAGLVLMGLLNTAKSGNVAAIRQILEMNGEDGHLKNEDKKVKIEQEKLKLLKEKDGGNELDKLDDILGKLTGDNA